MNILIPLGSGSSCNDLELRYCLRGICQNLTGWNKVIIVGRVPDWLNLDSIEFIPLNDIVGARNKEHNIYRKITAGLERSEKVLFMNDDHFLLENIAAAEFPYHHKGPLVENAAKLKRMDRYKTTLNNTLKLYPRAMNYDTHCPIIYERKLFAKVPANFPPYGHAIKTIYCEANNIKGYFYPDLKIGRTNTSKEIKDAVHSRMYFSTGAQAINQAMIEFLEMKYPVKSIFEM